MKQRQFVFKMIEHFLYKMERADTDCELGFQARYWSLIILQDESAAMNTARLGRLFRRIQSIISRLKTHPRRRFSRSFLTRDLRVSETFEFRVLLSSQTGPSFEPSSLTHSIGSAVSSNTGSTLLNGLNLNKNVGANRFYDAGFSGTKAIVANIEAGSVWNGHETLTNVAGYVREQSSPGLQTGQFDRHATWVGMLVAGKPTSAFNDYQSGIAPDATLYSGSIATTWTSSSTFTTAFNYDSATFIAPYRQLIDTGTAGTGTTADVVNSSWNNSDYTASASGLFSRGIDALVNTSRSTVVFSAGNTGSGPNSVGGPAAGYNVITVGALTSDTDPQPYQSIASISSRGLNDIFIPSVLSPTNINDAGQGTIISGARTVVDLAAPGTGITSATYTGSTGGNSGGSDSTPGISNSYSGNLNGSSFASPIVAGGSALIVDAAKTNFGASSSAVDGRVIKSILQTSAEKIPGWSNNQTLINGVVTTTQSLDPDSGAGKLNLSKAYDVLLSGTSDVAGNGGGNVQTSGWDIGSVGDGSLNDYVIQNVLAAGSSFTATLNWYVDRSIDGDNQTTEASFDNLDLEVWLSDGGTAVRKVAESISLYNNVEHLHFDIPETGTYLIRVNWAGEIWDLVNDSDIETFGLSWITTGLVDGGIPVASATADDIFLKGPTPQVIEIQLSDDTGILTQSITSSAVEVTGPGNTRWSTTLQSVTLPGIHPFVTATFQLVAPGGIWDKADDGNYQVRIVGNQIFDEAGNSVAATIAGSFTVQIVDRIGPDGFGYVASPESFSFTDISSTGTRILQNLDDASVELTDFALGDFQFNFYGSVYQSLFISTNGLISFESAATAALNTDLTTGLSPPAIAVLWDDLSTYGLNAAVYWKLEGSGNAMRLVIQWDRVEFLNGTQEITFQVLLDMSDNSILMNYMDLNGGQSAHNNGVSATTGIRSATQSLNTQLVTSYNGSSAVFVGNQRSVRYYDPRPATPVILLPAWDNRTFEPEFAWTPSSGAALYEVWVNQITTTPVLVVHETVVTTSLISPVSLEIGTYRIWVRAFSDQQDRSAWSVPITFRVTTATTINSLARLQQTAKPTVTWLPTPGAASYEIWLDNRSTGQAAFLRQDGLSTNSFTPATDLPFGDYRIWVRAIDRSGRPNGWSRAKDFAVAYWPTLTGPLGTTLNHQPTFDWSDIVGATSYQLFVRDVATKQIHINILLPPTSTYTLGAPLSTGVYDWWVRALAGNRLYGWWSYSSRVSIAGSPILESPLGNVGTSSPIFEWQAVDLALQYTLEIRSADNSGPGMIFDRLVGTTFQMKDPLVSGTYRAWIRAVSATGERTWWSRPLTFTITSIAQDQDIEGVFSEEIDNQTQIPSAVLTYDKLTHRASLEATSREVKDSQPSWHLSEIPNTAPVGFSRQFFCIAGNCNELKIRCVDSIPAIIATKQVQPDTLKKAGMLRFDDLFAW